MPTFISGLPVHVLVVHAVVVLVPLAVLGALAIAVWPAMRRRYGWLVVGVTAVATASIPIATDTGEGLRDRLPRTELISEHAELGDQLLVFVAVLLAAVVGLMIVHEYRARSARSEGPGATTVSSGLSRWAGPGSVALAVLAVAAALVSAVQVVRIGDSGARAAWEQTHYVAPNHDGD